MRQLLLIPLIASLTGCLADTGSSAAITQRPSTGIVAFDPTVANTFTGTWVDQADVSQSFTVDSSGNITGNTIGTWIGVGGPSNESCTFTGVLANTTTNISGNAYTIGLYLTTGSIHADHAYCPSYSTTSYPQTKQFQFNDQGNNCILSGGVIGYNRTYCKQ